MGIVDINQETQYDVIAIINTLQQLLEAAQNDNHQKTDGILQEKNILYNMQEKLEADLYTKDQELEAEKKKAQHWKRLYDDLDKSLYFEREEFDKDRHQWTHRESQLTDHIRLLKQQQHQMDKHQYYNQSANQNDTVLSSHSTLETSNRKKNCDHFAKDMVLSSGMCKYGGSFPRKMDQISQQRMINTAPANDSAEDTIEALKKRITQLKSDLEQQAIKLQHQHFLENDEASRKISHLLDQINSMKQLNRSLMEENESYRMLLHEKTISGDFLTVSIGRFIGDEYLNTIGDNKNEQRTSEDAVENIRKSKIPKENHGLNLADELALASSAEKATKENDLLTEIRTLQDENRALQLYMNKILLRIIESKHSENLLSIDEPNNPKKITVITKSIGPSKALSNTATSTTMRGQRQKSIDKRKTLSCQSFDSDATTLNGTEMANTTRRNDSDSWSHIFKRMGSGLGGWAKTTHSDTNYIVDSPLV
ncbi:hypothetical protein BCR42DRAFT_476291 [Absidia repens]|uniref:Uncharacterized protein n=1 Tax=Absidia repens TaxID=90262 RepID=A0A1X2IQW8_9FUNG|nr:hypothetical protein BCR42DRAFT_476291 [Absidia repens]